MLSKSGTQTPSKEFAPLPLPDTISLGKLLHLSRDADGLLEFSWSDGLDRLALGLVGNVEIGCPNLLGDGDTLDPGNDGLGKLPRFGDELAVSWTGDEPVVGKHETARLREVSVSMGVLEAPLQIPEISGLCPMFEEIRLRTCPTATSIPIEGLNRLGITERCIAGISGSNNGSKPGDTLLDEQTEQERACMVEGVPV